MPPLAAGRTSTNDVWMPPPRHPDERISIGRRRHPDERIFGYPLQALDARDVCDDCCAQSAGIYEYVVATREPVLG